MKENQIRDDLMFFIVEKEREVNKSKPGPFNLFPKATYIIQAYKEIYRFTTSLYSEEDCIKILLSKVTNKKVTIKKLQNGQEIILLQYKPTDKFKPISIIFNGEKKSIAEWAKQFNLTKLSLYRKLSYRGFDMQEVIDNLK